MQADAVICCGASGCLTTGGEVPMKKKMRGNLTFVSLPSSSHCACKVFEEDVGEYNAVASLLVLLIDFHGV